MNFGRSHRFLIAVLTVFGVAPREASAADTWAVSGSTRSEDPMVLQGVEIVWFWQWGLACQGLFEKAPDGQRAREMTVRVDLTNLSGTTKRVSPGELWVQTDSMGPLATNTAGPLPAKDVKPAETASLVWKRECVAGSNGVLTFGGNIENLGPTQSDPPDQIVRFQDKTTKLMGLRYRRSQEVLASPRFVDMGAPSEGLFTCMTPDHAPLRGYCDMKGNVVIDPRYVGTYPDDHGGDQFHSGRAWVCEDASRLVCHYINTKGETVPE